MGLSIWHLLVVLAIVLVLFGAKRLRNLGGDLGAAIKGFKDAVTDGSKKEGEQLAETQQAQAQQPAPAQLAQQTTPSPYAQPSAHAQQPTTIVQPAPTAQTTTQTAPQSHTHHQG